MARKVKEWIGKDDNSRPPPRVLLRIFQREKGICHISGRKIRSGMKWQADHKIALINGGANSESNLFPALVDKHYREDSGWTSPRNPASPIWPNQISASSPRQSALSDRPASGPQNASSTVLDRRSCRCQQAEYLRKGETVKSLAI